MTNKLQRPECFEFALDFLGGPENDELLAYIEQLEARAAELLQQRYAEAVPGPSDTRYEFSVCDTNYNEHASGSAPTYAQALSEGRRYLARLQQDGPHTLELRRVEVLNPDALPLPAGEVEE